MAFFFFIVNVALTVQATVLLPFGAKVHLS